MERVLHWIEGEAAASEDERCFDCFDPASGEVIATVALGAERDVDRAVRSGAAAYADGRWARMPGSERGRVLRRMAEGLRSRSDEFARLETLDTGKPISQTHGEVEDAASLLDYFSGLTEEAIGSVYPQKPGFFAYSRREPYGVVGAIAPWNFPLVLACWKTGPALAVGNSVVLKMAEQAPLTTARLGSLAQEAGMPDGVLNIVHGDGPTTGAALAAHPLVPKITFTGSTDTGRAILHAGAEHIKSVHLELGGKTANIVCADADIEQALAGTLFTSFFNAGQICTSGSRLLVAREIAADFVDAMTDRTRRLRTGDPSDETTNIGPLISAEQRDRVASYIEQGLSAGATAVVGGAPGVENRGGYFVRPTIFTGVQSDMTIAQEEIFGPVLSVMEFGHEDEAVALANDVPYGLAATVWTQDVGRAMRFAERIDAGIVWTNCPHHLTWNVPYEGFKVSGLGEDLGHESLNTFTQLKVHYLNFDGERVGWPSR
jgi:acyl-CoA reductase-like NAD-dependent aldehyde dehydrogenase